MITQEEIVALLQKNKKRLEKELQQNKELFALLVKYTHTKLSDEEKEQMRHQLIEVFKTIPAFAIFLLPGGLILLPIVAKLIPDILPSAFRGDTEE
ncbi:MAG: LETM1 domain-containing protein [Flavobacteriaceae bacterium]|nr:LETM1 domain-containing protein [Flavobacteriaceae bacterium]